MGIRGQNHTAETQGQYQETDRYVIGLDFGTASGRAVLVRVFDGAPLAAKVFVYPDGVMESNLHASAIELPPNWALQNPDDWLMAIENTVPGVISEAGVNPDAVIGIGIDFTSCTILPTGTEGTPLCRQEKYRATPHAWPKLWKHHAAQPQADRINALAHSRGEKFITRYGGKISSEWLFPKALEILEEAGDVWRDARRIIEGGDWVVWQLCGEEKRNACAAGYKACWHREEGYPSADFLGALHPDFPDLLNKLGHDLYPSGAKAGTLTPEWAERLGLTPETAVGVAIIDAHAGAPGSGVVNPNVMALVMGTSTCHMIMSNEEVLVEGISGVVADGIVPGLYGYEAGQAAVGDIFAWFVENGLPARYETEAKERGISPHNLLSEKASYRSPGESGLIALDWWNGCRTPLVDADLSGVIVGYSLRTAPEDIYRALVEATAYGTRLIIETFERGGVAVQRLVAGGGLTENRVLMQIYADVTGREIAVAGAGAASALGAAMLGSTAAGRGAGGYDTLEAASEHMVPQPQAIYRPDAQSKNIYDRLYAEYLRLVDIFGKGESSVSKRLNSLAAVS